MDDVNEAVTQVIFVVLIVLARRSIRTYKLKKLQCPLLPRRHPHLGNTSLQLVCKGLSAIALSSSTYILYKDKKTRDKAIKNLSVFLSDTTRDVISKPDMDKLWKGIFYCAPLPFFMRDFDLTSLQRFLDVR